MGNLREIFKQLFSYQPPYTGIEKFIYIIIPDSIKIYFIIYPIAETLETKVGKLDNKYYTEVVHQIFESGIIFGFATL